MTYRSLLTGELLQGFNSWLASDDQVKARQWHQAILSSGALTLTAEHMMGIVEEAERLIEDLPEDCAQIDHPNSCAIGQSHQTMRTLGAAVSSFFLIHDHSLIVISND